MTAKEYIEKKLAELKSGTKAAADLKSTKDLADFIFKTVMSKKFRKFSVSPDFLPHIHGAIENSIENNQPIKLVFPFGGYKLWRLEETPEADWAELFTLMYYAAWLKPIADVYKPGVWFDFSSDDMIVERLNNIPKSDTESYAKSFNEIINFLKNYLPENIEFTLTPVSLLYAPEEFEKDLKDSIAIMQKELGGLPVLDEHAKSMVELNVKLKPGQDSDPLWREKTELLHQAYYIVSRRRPYNRAKDKIPVFCIRTKAGNYLSVGTTKTSVAKFWVGVGALKKKDNEFKEYILSPSQLKSSSFTKEKISIKGLEAKNFKSIRIIN